MRTSLSTSVPAFHGTLSLCCTHDTCMLRSTRISIVFSHCACSISILVALLIAQTIISSSLPPRAPLTSTYKLLTQRCQLLINCCKHWRARDTCCHRCQEERKTERLSVGREGFLNCGTTSHYTPQMSTRNLVVSLLLRCSTRV